MAIFASAWAWLTAPPCARSQLYKLDQKKGSCRLSSAWSATIPCTLTGPWLVCTIPLSLPANRPEPAFFWKSLNRAPMSVTTRRKTQVSAEISAAGGQRPRVLASVSQTGFVTEA